MIRIHLARILADKHLSQRKLAAQTGLRPNTISGLCAVGEKRAKRIDFDTVNALCEALECQPGDLFEYVPDDESTTSYETK